MIFYSGMKMRFLFASAAVALFAYATPALAYVNLNSVSITSSKDQIKADGIDQAMVRVRVSDENSLPVSGAAVKIYTSRGALDEITPSPSTVTNGFGKAEFMVRSLKNGKTTITAEVNGQRASASYTIEFVNGLDIGLAPGSLIKIPSDNDDSTYADTAVYYFASNGRRYVFPNEKVYFTWYSSFDNVRVLSIEDMTKVPIGGNVTYHPGSKPVKFQTDDNVYAVYKGGELQWMKTESVARGIYGDNWTSKVDDISEAFYVNYKFGAPLTSATDFMSKTIFDRFSTIEIDKGL